MPASSPSLSLVRTFGRWLLLVAAAAGGLGAACADWKEVFADRRQVFFVDADCYARMTRVRIVCEHPGRVLAAHDFENYPYGTRPHTTALFDYLIWALRGALNVFSSVEMRDVAGAWISPLLGLAAVVGVGVWANRQWLPGRLPMFLILAASPILAHGFALGRPDHQSLALACMAWALAAEWSLWREPSRGWGWVSGIAWALGLWTSLYEPLILLAVVFAAGLFFNRPALWRRERLPGLAAGGVILLIALAVEGWRVDTLPGHGGGLDETLFAAWSQQIAELHSVPPWDVLLLGWVGLGLFAAPILLLWRRREEDADAADSRRSSRAHAFLVVAVWALTCWQIRWGYFLPLVYAMSLPDQFRAFPSRWRPAVAVVLIGGMWPVANEWRAHFNPPPDRVAALAEEHQDRALLRETAEFIGRGAADPAIGAAPAVARGILAPWWQCPALVYWSGQPAVAGSSHESLHGIADTARFYLETDARKAAETLRDRQVRWIIAYEPDRVLKDTAAPLLGRAVPPRCLGNILYSRPRLAPTFLRLAMANEYFKVYEVQPAALP